LWREVRRPLHAMPAQAAEKREYQPMPRPIGSKCWWLSLNAGTASRPATSMRRRPGPAHARPTAATRPAWVAERLGKALAQVAPAEDKDIGIAHGGVFSVVAEHALGGRTGVAPHVVTCSCPCGSESCIEEFGSSECPEALSPPVGRDGSAEGQWHRT